MGQPKSKLKMWIHLPIKFIKPMDLPTLLQSPSQSMPFPDDEVYSPTKGNTQTVYAWGLNRKGELSLSRAAKQEYVENTVCTSCPQLVAGFSKMNPAKAIYSGEVISVAVTQQG